MLWYKSWLETRWRFLAGVLLLACSAATIVLMRPQVLKLLPMVRMMDLGGELGRRIREAADLSLDYRGYVWLQWFGKKMTVAGTLFAVLLGTGGLLSQPSGGGMLFTLSLPASRNRLLAVRAAAGLAEWLVVVFVSSMVIPLVSPAIGEKYGVGDTLIHSACAFVAGAAFFSLAFLLSTVFHDLWRPMLIALFAATVLGLAAEVFDVVSRYSIFSVMSGDAYYKTGVVPWLGLLACVAASAAMLYGAAVNIARQDF